jgi:hypothetical protein
VWDFLSGQVIASWKPEMQVYDGPDNKNGRPPRRFTEPPRFAISPDGRAVIDGSNGMITLYKILVGPSQ